MRIRLVVVGFLCLQSSAPSHTTASAARPQAGSREAITSRLAELRRIHTPDGIDALEQVTLGGVRQWVSIRGQHRRNPVLLVIHGGPGSPTMPLSWAYQGPWEEFFTVVQWDQRGVGKNAADANRGALTPTLTAERIIADAVELAGWLRSRLATDRIVVMGYSYGSMIATALVQRTPEWFHAYVGVGQMAPGGDAHIYARLLELAEAAGHAEALRELRAIAPYPRSGQTMADLLLVRKWARFFNGGWYGKPTFDLLFDLPEWAPEYSQADLDAQADASRWFARTVMANPGPRVERGATFRVPVVLIMGRHDLHTPYEPAREWLESVTAPRKHLVTLDHAAHVPMLEQPGHFLLALIEHVLPLTRRPPGQAPRRRD